MFKVIMLNGTYRYGTEIRFTWDGRTLLLSFNGEFEEKLDPMTIQRIIPG